MPTRKQGYFAGELPERARQAQVIDRFGYLHIEDGWVKRLAADREVPIGDRDKLI